MAKEFPTVVKTAKSAGLRNLGWGALIFAVTLLVYLPAYRGGLLWDDASHITVPELRSWHGLERIWCEVGATQQYYPVLHTAFWFEHRLWGDETLGYHLINVLLHATSACLLGLILRRLAVPGAWLAATLFALHPVCVESVAWISEQKNTLSTVFYLGATLAYLRFDERRQGRLYVLASGLFVLALLSKSVTATLPAALLVILWWKRGRLSWRHDAVPLLPWLAAGVSAGLFTAWVERTYIHAVGAGFDLSLLQRCLVAGRAVWFYLGKLVWPADLVFIYPRWKVDATAAWQYAFPLAALGALVGLWLLRKRTRAPLAAALLFAGSLLPALGFFNAYPFRFSFVADHFQYGASLGMMALAAAGVVRIRTDRMRWLHWTLSGSLLGALGMLTWSQCGTYCNAETLYRTTLQRNPDCWLAHNNLGGLLIAAGRASEAVGHFERTLRLNPGYVEAEHNLGIALTALGRQEEAIACYETALRLEPDSAETHLDLGKALARIPARVPEAIAEYEAALRIRPDFAEAHYSLGNALMKAPGRLPEAVSHFEAALRIKPDFAEAHNNLGTALLDIPGRQPEAASHFEAALRVKPDFAQAHNNLGIALANMPGRLPEAIIHFEAALRIEPDFAAARNNLRNARQLLDQLPTPPH